MGRGYGLLWRRFFDHPLWKEPRVFSRAEAWIDIVFCLARGTDDVQSRIKRGEFQASLTYLARRWNWDKAKVQRFMTQLTSKADPMLLTVGGPGSDIRHYRVVKYGHYQTPRSSEHEPPLDLPFNNHNGAIGETPSDTPSDTLRETPKPKKPLVDAATGETPPDTPRETPRDTKVNKRRNTGEKNTYTCADSRHREFVKFLHDHFSQVAVGPADYKALKDMLSGTKNNPAYTSPRLELYWNSFAASTNAFDREQGLSVSYFCRRINRFVAIAPKERLKIQDFHHRPEFTSARHVCVSCAKPHEHDEDCDDFHCEFNQEKPCRSFLKKHRDAQKGAAV